MAEIGSVIGGRYRLLEMLGEGSFAAVFRAEDLEQKRAGWSALITRARAAFSDSISPRGQPGRRPPSSSVFTRRVNSLRHSEFRSCPPRSAQPRPTARRRNDRREANEEFLGHLLGGGVEQAGADLGELSADAGIDHVAEDGAVAVFGAVVLFSERSSRGD